MISSAPKLKSLANKDFFVAGHGLEEAKKALHKGVQFGKRLYKGECIPRQTLVGTGTLSPHHPGAGGGQERSVDSTPHRRPGITTAPPLPLESSLLQMSPFVPLNVSNFSSTLKPHGRLMLDCPGGPRPSLVTTETAQVGKGQVPRPLVKLTSHHPSNFCARPSRGWVRLESRRRS